MLRLDIIDRNILDARADIKKKMEDIQVIYLEIINLQQEKEALLTEKIKILEEGKDEKNL